MDNQNFPFYVVRSSTLSRNTLALRTLSKSSMESFKEWYLLSPELLLSVII